MPTFEDNLARSKAAVDQFKNSLKDHLDSTYDPSVNLLAIPNTNSLDSNEVDWVAKFKNDLQSVKQKALTQDTNPVIDRNNNINLHKDGSYSVDLPDGSRQTQLTQAEAARYSAMMLAEHKAALEDAPLDSVTNLRNQTGQVALDVVFGIPKGFMGDTNLQQGVNRYNAAIDTASDVGQFGFSSSALQPKQKITQDDINVYQAIKSIPADERKTSTLNYEGNILNAEEVYNSDAYKLLEKIDKETTANKARVDTLQSFKESLKKSIPANWSEEAAAEAAYKAIADNEGNWSAIKNALSNDLGTMLKSGVSSIPYMVAFTVGGPITQTGIMVGLARENAQKQTEAFIKEKGRKPSLEEQARIDTWAAVSTVAEKFGDLAAVKAIPISRIKHIDNVLKEVEKFIPSSIKTIGSGTAKVTGALAGEGLSGAISEASNQMAVSGEITDPNAIAYGALTEALGTPGGVAGMTAANLAYNTAKKAPKAIKATAETIAKGPAGIIDTVSNLSENLQQRKATSKKAKEDKKAFNNLAPEERISTKGLDASVEETMKTIKREGLSGTTKEEMKSASIPLYTHLKNKVEEAITANDTESADRFKKAADELAKLITEKAAAFDEANKVETLSPQELRDNISSIVNATDKGSATWTTRLGSTIESLKTAQVSEGDTDNLLRLSNEKLTPEQKAVVDNARERISINQVAQQFEGTDPTSKNKGIAQYLKLIEEAVGLGATDLAKNYLKDLNKWYENQKEKVRLHDELEKAYKSIKSQIKDGQISEGNVDSINLTFANKGLPIAVSNDRKALILDLPKANKPHYLEFSNPTKFRNVLANQAKRELNHLRTFKDGMTNYVKINGGTINDQVSSQQSANQVNQEQAQDTGDSTQATQTQAEKNAQRIIEAVKTWSKERVLKELPKWNKNLDQNNRRTVFEALNARLKELKAEEKTAANKPTPKPAQESSDGLQRKKEQEQKQTPDEKITESDLNPPLQTEEDFAGLSDLEERQAQEEAAQDYASEVAGKEVEVEVRTVNINGVDYKVNFIPRDKNNPDLPLAFTRPTVDEQTGTATYEVFIQKGLTSDEVIEYLLTDEFSTEKQAERLKTKQAVEVKFKEKYGNTFIDMIKGLSDQEIRQVLILHEFRHVIQAQKRNTHAEFKADYNADKVKFEFDANEFALKELKLLIKAANREQPKSRYTKDVFVRIGRSARIYANELRSIINSSNMPNLDIKQEMLDLLDSYDKNGSLGPRQDARLQELADKAFKSFKQIKEERFHITLDEEDGTTTTFIQENPIDKFLAVEATLKEVTKFYSSFIKGEC